MFDEPKQKEHVFLIPVDRIQPNQYQPRTEFDEAALKGLAESIRQYGILQPLVVTRVERETAAGTQADYELIAGERRYRAACLLGLPEVPVIIRREEPAKVRLEMALVENIQRQDLNAIERALAYKRLIDEFKIDQKEIALRIGKSREAVANTIRILALPEDMQQAVATGAITEGHTRPLLMLSDRTSEQRKLFDDIVERHISVREAEGISRRIAHERARKIEGLPSVETRALEAKLEEVLGTRVVIAQEARGRGKISIDFFSDEELYGITAKLAKVPAEIEIPEPVSHETIPASPPPELPSFADDSFTV